MKIALHACCGPCALEPLDAIAAEHEVALVFANPNIQPAEEYRLRWDTLREWAEGAGIPVVELPDGPDAWLDATRDVRETPGLRCPRCYSLRLDAVAAYAAQHGYDGLATTLSVSPYQDAEAIDAAGRRAADSAGLIWLAADHRERYAEATRRSRELGMYRQNYCGCLPSKAQAEAERAERRAARARRRDGASE